MTTKYNYTFTNEAAGDTASNPDSFLNPSNAFDDNDATTSTLSFTSTGADDKTIGTTFSSKTISIAFIKVSTNLGSTAPFVNNIILQKYNGSSWVDVRTLTSGTSTTNSFNQVVLDIGVCQGLRVKFETESSSGNSVVLTVNDILYAQTFTYTTTNLCPFKGGVALEDRGDLTAIAEDHTVTYNSFYQKYYSDNTGGTVTNSTTETDLATITITQDDFDSSFNAVISAGFQIEGSSASASIHTLKLYVNGSVVKTITQTLATGSGTESSGGSIDYMASGLNSTAGDIIIKITGTNSVASTAIITTVNGLVVTGINNND